jgi:lysophospholipase L1-like esterase
MNSYKINPSKTGRFCREGTGYSRLGCYIKTSIRIWVFVALLARSGFGAPALAQVLPGNPAKVMPLGDSITEGYTVSGGYRTNLWDSLVSEGSDVDFIGSQTSGPSSLSDKNHEGHPGYFIDQIAENISTWLPAYKPETVLLLIGTNDIEKNNEPGGAPTRLSGLMDQIVALRPTARLYVASIPPADDSAINQRVLDYNAAIPGLVNGKVLQGKKVVYVDIYSALTTDDLADVVHPDAEGYAKIAERWFEALRVASLAGNPKSDFSDDGQWDILWRNGANGRNTVWLMNGSARSAVVELPAVSDPNWRSVGTADFDFDGKPDILWRNTKTGANSVWFMDGTKYRAAISLPTVGDPKWQIAGAADFNFDGKPDILWRNQATGANSVWLMDGAVYRAAVTLQAVADLGWQIGGTGDFDANGTPDILWRNTATGANAIWKMNGLAFLSSVSVPSVGDLGWQSAGAGDFSGDGKPDILWRNTATGSNALWQMDGTAFVQSVPIEAVADLAWQIGGPR